MSDNEDKMSFRERLLTSLFHAIHIAHGGESVNPCPHCEEAVITPIYPLQPIVIGTCGYCNQYIIPFAGHLLPISADVVDRGEMTDLRFAIVQAISKLLHQATNELVGDMIYTDKEAAKRVIEQLNKTAKSKMDNIPDNLEDLEQLWKDQGDESDSGAS